MAAGLGFKDFTTGEVLTAADVDGYLMQGIWVFANSAARDAAVTSPQEGNFAFLKDTNTTTYYTGSAWTNLDTTGMVNPMTTTGDTIYSSSGSTPARLGIGSTGQVLTVAGGVPSWATPSSSGGMTLISETVANANSSITFSSLGSYKQLLLMWHGIRHSTTGSDFTIRFNNNSSAIYNINGLQFVGNNVTTLSADNGTSVKGFSNTYNIFAFGKSVANAYSGTDCFGSLLLDNYTSSTKSKSYNIMCNYYNSGDNHYAGLNTTSFFDDTTAITSIDIVRLTGTATISNSGNSTIRLYGIS